MVLKEDLGAAFKVYIPWYALVHPFYDSLCRKWEVKSLGAQQLQNCKRSDQNPRQSHLLILMLLMLWNLTWMKYGYGLPIPNRRTKESAYSAHEDISQCMSVTLDFPFHTAADCGVPWVCTEYYSILVLFACWARLKITTDACIGSLKMCVRETHLWFTSLSLYGSRGWRFIISDSGAS